MTPLYVLILFCSVSFAGFIIIFFLLKPRFQELAESIRLIHRENITFGIHSYFGRIMDVSTYQLDRLMIAFFANSTSVGFYSLAMSMANPLNSFSSALSSSKYKDFSDHMPISKKIILVNRIWTLVGLLGIWILGYLVVHFVLGVEFKEVYLLFVILSVSTAFQANYQPYNAWLASNGYGKELKKSSFIMAGVNLTGNLALIPFWGVIGAAIASVFGTLTYLICSVIYYSSLNAKQPKTI